MAVEQEMAEIYPPTVEEVAEFLPDIDCGTCGFPSCVEFGAAVLADGTNPQKCPELSQEVGNLLALIEKLEPRLKEIIRENHS